ncbi:hypothetical protein KPL71_024267 [Citrus sinensis]|uniref:Uncharacterized protein n=1 Tax=Citrus sinensis TaxID=2711 RepID=A0ACB8IQ90_CITSI|nr:hypothetical protein KPL71_024267 [Citrus sinensis]
MPLTKNEVGEDIPKPSQEWNGLEKRKASLNSKVMNVLFCALDKKEFHRVSSCESANEIWHKLEVVYEGTNEVKESKISRYTRQYELFQMEQNESVYSMYTRFTDIVNTLGALGNTFSNSEKVKKIIRSLLKEWRPKRIAIEEAKDLNILPIDDLIGSLISYEEDMATERGNEERKKSIAFKASKYESDEESELDEEEMDMLARKFRNFFKKSSERRKFRDLKNRKDKKEVIKCYECKKPGHIRSECPLLNKLKKKAMVATWDDIEEETSDDEEHQEMTNLALMAIGDESNDELDEVNDLPTYDELHDAFKELHDEWMKIDSIRIESGLPDMVKRQTGFLGSKLLEHKWLTEFRKRQAGYSEIQIFALAWNPQSRCAWRRGRRQDLAIEKWHEEKKKSIALKASKFESDEESELDDEEMVMLTRRFRKFYKKTRSECPLLNKLKKKTMVATWDDSDEETSDDEEHQEMTNLVLMAIGEESLDELDEDNLGKFDPKSDVGIFLEYSNSSKTYRVYNKRTLVVEESMHVTFDESNPSSAEKVDSDADKELQEESSKDNKKDAPHGNQEEQHEETNAEQNEGTSQSLPKEWSVSMADSSRRTRKRKATPSRTPIPPQETSEFEGIHFPTAPLAKRFEDRFIGRKVLDSYYVDIEDFKELIVCGRSVRNMLLHWESAINFDKRVYYNLVRVFYSNMEISATRLDRIVTHVGGVSIEFDVEELNNILGILNAGHKI